MKYLLVLIALVSTTSTYAKTDWWEVGAVVLGGAIAVASTSKNQNAREVSQAAEVIIGSANDGQGLKKYILPTQYEANLAAYSEWIKVGRSRNLLMPEMDEGLCIYRMNAGLIELDADRFDECPKYVAVHPKNYY
ncbi:MULTISPECIES: hypothetical protein [Acinetobacter]|uniref:hypothetical protein n=1 Tax=Acinetobacter TaxID=469 RepID=UPI0011224C43|nr:MULTISPECIES: hypothetical protein [Acinetobacter]